MGSTTVTDNDGIEQRLTQKKAKLKIKLRESIKETPFQKKDRLEKEFDALVQGQMQHFFLWLANAMEAQCDPFQPR